MKRKKAIIAIVCLLLAGLVIFFFYRYSLQNASKADEFDDASIDVSEYADFLEQAGVPKENIDSLEHSIIKYIAEDLKSKEAHLSGHSLEKARISHRILWITENLVMKYMLLSVTMKYMHTQCST